MIQKNIERNYVSFTNISKRSPCEPRFGNKAPPLFCSPVCLSPAPSPFCATSSSLFLSFASVSLCIFMQLPITLTPLLPPSLSSHTHAHARVPSSQRGPVRLSPIGPWTLSSPTGTDRPDRSPGARRTAGLAGRGRGAGREGGPAFSQAHPPQ